MYDKISFYQTFQPYSIPNRGKQYLHTVGIYTPGISPLLSIQISDDLPTFISPMATTMRLLKAIFTVIKSKHFHTKIQTTIA